MFSFFPDGITDAALGRDDQITRFGLVSHTVRLRLTREAEPPVCIPRRSLGTRPSLSEMKADEAVWLRFPPKY